jgi:hypothetical protein
MISRSELQRLANRENVALGTLEKDYLLTEALKALSRVISLSDILVFKGGITLRKIYFTDWRYSEDGVSILPLSILIRLCLERATAISNTARNVLGVDRFWEPNPL